MTLANGYYAVPDPDDPGVITCWRYNERRGRTTFGPWSKGASYGDPTRPSRRQYDRDSALAYVRWSAEARAAIETDQNAARRLFAEITSHCGLCGREIHERDSILTGVGPECRKKVPA